MRSTILVAAVLAFASLALGGCTADAQDPKSDDSNVTSGQGASPVAETNLRDGVEKAPSLIALDDNVRDIATNEADGRFDAKRIDGVKNPQANALADTRRDVSGNGGLALGLADGRLDNVEAPANADLFETSLDEAVQVNANSDDIRRKARATK